jgi:hypothetical protein
LWFSSAEPEAQLGSHARAAVGGMGLVVDLDDQLGQLDVVRHLRGRVRLPLPPGEER